MPDRVVVLSIPQLRHRDVTPGALASLENMEMRGGIATFHPAMPALAAPSFATIATGTRADVHGIIGDAYFDRTHGRVVQRPFEDGAVLAPKLWERLKQERPEAKTLAWFTPNLQGASVDRAAWVDTHDGLRTNPPELAETLIAAHGVYSSPRSLPGGEPLRIEAATWILRTAAAAIRDFGPDLAFVRVPFLGQIAQRHGPDGREAGRGLRALEGILRPFLAALPAATLTIAVTESVATPVSEPIYPNRTLKELGVLRFTGVPGRDHDIDVRGSAAFALADHQLCHVYVNEAAQAPTIASSFSADPYDDGIRTVACGDRRAALNLNHSRAGDIVLVAEPGRWFSPVWWTDRGARPASADTPSGLLLGRIPDPAQVCGSLGAPPPNDDYLGVLISSSKTWLGSSGRVSAGELYERLSASLGISRPRDFTIVKAG